MVFVVSCRYDYRNPISGNGKVNSSEIKVAGFSKLQISDNLNVLIIPYDTEKVVIEADENIVNIIKVEQKDSVLKIFTDRKIRMARSKKVIVYSNKLNQIEVSSASNITCGDSLISDHLKVVANSAANVKIFGHFNLLEVEASSASEVTLGGITLELNVNISSAAELHAFNLTAEKANVVATSAADARVYVTGEAWFDASSAADIIYRGNPAIRNIQSSSAGDIKKSDK
jgi:hypothetical protein